MCYKKEISIFLFLFLFGISFSQETVKVSSYIPTVIREFDISTKDGILKDNKTAMRIKRVGAAGTILSEEVIYMMLGVQNTKTFFNYSKAGKLMLEERKELVNKYNEYRDHIRVAYKYDRKGNCVKKNTQTQINNRWKVNNVNSVADFKKKYQYNKEGNITQVIEKKWDSIAKKFVVAAKYETHWVDQKPVSYLTYGYDTKAKTWNLTSSADSLKWDSQHTFTPSEEITEEYIDKNAIYLISKQYTDQKLETRMNKMKNLTSITIMIDSLNPQNQWIPYAKSISTKDRFGNETEFEYFKNEGNGLVSIFHDKNVLEYDDKGHLIKETKGSLMDGQNITFWKKIEYDSFVPCKK